ncbi:GGDEF domain-containing protein [Oceanicella actignis]|uniref:GGDEF domain-containing protein n=1 Tax=Oceanicella actignis TaxID=1189325 RepID=UPI0011E88C7A|nr:GGDEF domain-containing protein [Oceanicella actignis]TYO89668.1 diguanylate cyclase [Oceanicella actignis]
MAALVKSETGFDEDFEAQEALARKALDLAHARRLPPTPRVFEVLYGYVRGEPEGLRNAVGALLERDESPALSAIERIYEEHLALGAAPVRLLSLGQTLDGEMGEVVERLARRETEDARFMGALTRIREGVNLLSRASTVREAAESLIDVTGAHAAQTSDLTSQLRAARRKIEDLSRDLKDLREAAYLDHLTQLPNRRRLDAVLEAEIAAAPERGPLCFALADIDRFKQLNDRYGHAVGDSVLKEFGRILKLNLKGKDTPARFGGEEFAMVLPATHLMGARHIAEKIRQELAAKSFVVAETRERLGTVTVSVGVTQLREGEDAAALIKRADELLYKAKEAGRNRVASAA